MGEGRSSVTVDARATCPSCGFLTDQAQANCENCHAPLRPSAEPHRPVRLSKQEASALLRVVRGGITVYGFLTAGAVLGVVYGLEQGNWIVLAIAAFFLVRTVPALVGLVRARRSLQRGELPADYAPPGVGTGR